VLWTRDLVSRGTALPLGDILNGDTGRYLALRCSDGETGRGTERVA